MTKLCKSFGLDLSLTRTGMVAVDEDGKILFHGVVKSKPLGPTPKHEIKRLLDISGEVKGLVQEFHPEIVVIEGLAFMAKGTSLTILSGLSYLVRADLYSQKIPFILVAPTSLKKFITGSGKGEKDHMLLEIYKNYKFTACTNDEADAMGLAVCGLALLGKPVKKLTIPQQEVLKLLKNQWT